MLNGSPRNQPYLFKDTRSSGEKRSAPDTKKVVTPNVGEGFDFIARLEKLFVVFPTYLLILKIPLKGEVHAISLGA